MNIYWFELKSILKSTIIWAASLCVFLLVIMSMFPSYVESADEIRAMLSGYSATALEAMGVNLDTLFSVMGFYSFILLYINLAGAVQAANLGIGLISKENRAKTSDFLFTKPVERRTVVTSKFLAALSALMITNLVYVPASLLFCRWVADTSPDYTALLLIAMTLFFIQLSFLFIGAAAGAFVRHIRSVTALSLGLVLLFFMISMVESLFDKDHLRFLTPFRYFDTSAIMTNQAYEWSSLLTVLIVCVLCGAVTFAHVIRQDVHAV